jgi:hypothetical protein
VASTSPHGSSIDRYGPPSAVTRVPIYVGFVNRDAGVVLRGDSDDHRTDDAATLCDNVDRASDSLGCEQDSAVVFADSADAGGVSVAEEAVDVDCSERMLEGARPNKTRIRHPPSKQATLPRMTSNGATQTL